ncbi:hypothetical protein ACV35P_32955, partial [Pseudomonas aeruginosa]
MWPPSRVQGRLSYSMNKSLTLLNVTLVLGGCQSLIHKTPGGTPPVEDTAVETKAKLEKDGSFSEESLY